MRHRILHILPWITSGGVEKRRLQIVEQLDPTRYEQRLICKEMRGAVAEQLADLGVRVDVIPGEWTAFDIESMAQIIGHIEAWRPDIIHGAVFEGVTMSSFCGYLGQVPHVLIEETGGTQWRSWRGDLLLALASMLSERCIAVSPHIARYLAQRSQLSEQKIHLIINGITSKPLPSALASNLYRDELGIPRESLIIGSLGRVFNKFKRFSDLICAFASLDPLAYTHPPYLVIGGTGPDIKSLQELVDSLGVAERVRLPGYISDPSRIYGIMDIFALVSASESFGLVVVEAMSAGLPVVASRIDAFLDIIDEGETGLLVPVHDTEALASTFDTLLNSPSLRKKLGVHAKIIAERDYSSQRYVCDVEALYHQLLSFRNA